MSFVVEYRPFINVAVEEDATNVPLPVLRFTPTPASIRILADRHLAFRRRDAGFQIFYQSNPMAADPLLGAITSRIRLTFAATLIRPDLLETFEPDLTSETGSQLHFDNLTPSGNIQAKSTLTTSTIVQAADASRVHPLVFEATADLSVPSPPTEWRVLDRFDSSIVVHTELIPSTATGATRTKIDLAKKQVSGPYTLATDEATPPARSIYVDAELAYMSVAGVLDLYWETRQDTVPAGGLDYFIRFRRR
ncbi:MAG TPA: hypothetical protein VGA18_06250 [Rhodothermales bacterium]